MGGGGGGGTISDSILGRHKTIFLLILYNFGNIWGGGGARAPLPPYSLVPASENVSVKQQKNLTFALLVW